MLVGNPLHHPTMGTCKDQNIVKGFIRSTKVDLEFKVTNLGQDSTLLSGLSFSRYWFTRVTFTCLGKCKETWTTNQNCTSFDRCSAKEQMILSCLSVTWKVTRFQNTFKTPNHCVKSVEQNCCIVNNQKYCQTTISSYILYFNHTSFTPYISSFYDSFIQYFYYSLYISIYIHYIQDLYNLMRRRKYAYWNYIYTFYCQNCLKLPCFAVLYRVGDQTFEWKVWEICTSSVLREIIIRLIS